MADSSTADFTACPAFSSVILETVESALRDAPPLLLQAALGAGMRCVVTYTDSTADQDFHGAEHIMAEFKADTKLADLLKGDTRSDDRPGRQDSTS